MVGAVCRNRADRRAASYRWAHLLELDRSSQEVSRCTGVAIGFSSAAARRTFHRERCYQQDRCDREGFGPPLRRRAARVVSRVCAQTELGLLPKISRNRGGVEEFGSKSGLALCVERNAGVGIVRPEKGPWMGHKSGGEGWKRLATAVSHSTHSKSVTASFAGCFRPFPLLPLTKRTTGLEPATFGLGSRRSTN
jgi:hypothetical protein